MLRTFSLTLANANQYYELFATILTIEGAVPVDGILPDRCKELTILNAPTNAAGYLTLGDNNAANTHGGSVPPSGSFTKRSNRNTICLRDYNLVSSVANLIVDIDIEYV